MSQQRPDKVNPRRSPQKKEPSKSDSSKTRDGTTPEGALTGPISLEQQQMLSQVAKELQGYIPIPEEEEYIAFF